MCVTWSVLLQTVASFSDLNSIMKIMSKNIKLKLSFSQVNRLVSQNKAEGCEYWVGGGVWMCARPPPPESLDMWVLSLITGVRKFSHLSWNTCCWGRQGSDAARAVAHTASNHQKSFTHLHVQMLHHPPSSNPLKLQDSLETNRPPLPPSFNSSNRRGFLALACARSWLRAALAADLLLVNWYVTLCPIAAVCWYQGMPLKHTG